MKCFPKITGICNVQNLSSPLTLKNFLIFLTVNIFQLRWISYRNIAVGFCSGIGRLGAILGIFLGEHKQLHLSTTVMFVMGFLMMVSAVFLKLLPDLTKHKMPRTLKELEDIQFGTNNSLQEDQDQRSTQISLSTVESQISQPQ